MANPLGAAPGIILGTGLGAAAATAITPVMESARQTAWTNNRVRILSPAQYAQLVAQGAIELDAGRDGAHLEGLTDAMFDPLVYLAQRAPTHAEAQDLRRRGKITADQLLHAFAKEQIEKQYWEGLADLVDERISPQVVALAIVRGLMTNPGILPVGPPTAVGKVPAFPVSDIDPVTEAASGGVNLERLAVLAGIQGRPMGPEAAAAAVFRGILELVDYERAIAEGDVRNEWASAIFETARQIPSPSDYVRMHIKGWIDEPTFNAGAARHGMTADDAHLLYLAAGRPAAPGQMATAVARGVDGPDGVPMDEAQFKKGIVESDIRPEWAEMLWGIRYQYPPLFQLTRLVQSGAIDAATAADWAEKDRYAPEVVAALLKGWQASGTSTTAATRAKSAQTQAITALKRSFLRGEQTPETAKALLEQLGLDAGEADQVVGYWQAELTFASKPLAPAQIKKAYAENLKSRDEAIAELVAAHFSVADANTFLSI